MNDDSVPISSGAETGLAGAVHRRALPEALSDMGDDRAHLQRSAVEVGGVSLSQSGSFRGCPLR